MNKKKEKEITNIELLESINSSFDKMEAKMATKEALKIQQNVLDIMIKEIKTIHEDNKYFRQNISSLNSDGLSYDRKIEDLTVRVEKLELKAQ